ncbi:sensor histidine kinase [Paucisalibacillus sp. EB02]|uniref:sensor histidine kinase n=1 Tax=Paucisalibacillus sp. EB02 TaxID=1347087 RepID=UPI0005A6C6F0|nr:sensor histidine kinase [Paucisalibacillus sp. EB02]
MRSYWLWLLFNIIVWPFALLYFNQKIDNMTLKLLGTALYFTIFFITPLWKQKPKPLLFLLGMNGIIAILTLYPINGVAFNPYLLLILTLVIAEGFYYLNFRDSLLLAIFIFISILVASFNMELPLYIRIFISLYWILFIAAMLVYKKTKGQSDDLEARYEALLSEYRSLKRRRVSDDEVTRQEERMLIAHEIHDSVGHKLTALLLQLEAFRLDVSEKDKEHVQSLKWLASESLEETRRAVKSLKTSETGGLPGVLRLIRKLEMESFMRIHFSVKHGASTAPLTGEQAFVIYRSVQEALTNIMKHSTSREAEIMFEAPGGSIFRFEINNPITEHQQYQEGFGLISMRERLERFGGDLEVFQTDEQFIIRGYFKIEMGIDHGSDITGRRSGDGKAGPEKND